MQYRLGGWEPPWGIVYVVDLLNALVLVVISVLAFINLITVDRSIKEEFSEKSGAFYTLYVLFVTGLMGIVVTGDLFNLYVLLEITSLSSYALIALGKDRAAISSLNYVFMGTIGACFYLLGVGYLYIMTGSLNMADVASILPKLYHSSAILVAFIFCMVGVWIKMALFPLHVWLPNAYTFAPSPVSSLLAPLMTKGMVYVMLRLMLTVFTPAYAFIELGISDAIVWLSTIAILVGAFFALTQKNLKRMFTYIIVSEIGYMVGGAWIGNQAGITGTILHIMNDATMTLCLFLAANSIAHKVGALDFENLRGLFRKMPFTMAALVAGALGMIGVPPSCGFFSKWYLISGAVQANHYGFMTALLLSSLINAILFFRVIEFGYFEPVDAHHDHNSHHHESHGSSIEESPPLMLVPLLIVAVGIFVLGTYTGDIVTHIVGPFVTKALGL